MIENVVEIKSGDEIYAIDGSIIYKILKPVPITPVPLVDSSVKGVCSIDGKIAVCIDTNILLRKESSNLTKMIAVEVDGGLYALLVEDVIGIEFLEEGYEKDEEDEGIEGFYHKNGKVRQILNLKKLLERVELLTFQKHELPASSSDEEVKGRKQQNLEPFVLFKVGSEFFGIKADFLKEIIFANRKITKLAESTDEVMGIITVRDRAIKVIDTKKLLFNEESEVKKESRFLIISFNGKDTALLVDEVIDIKDIDTLQIEREEGKEGVVEGVIKHGENIVSIVSQELLEKLVETHAIGFEDSKEETDYGEGEMKEVVAFMVSNEEYGVEVQQVEEIVRLPEITPVPETPHYVKGVMNLRGEVVPVVSLPLRLGFEEKITKKSKVIVCNVKNSKVGFLVDSVNEVISIDEKHINVSTKEDSVIKEIANLDNGKRIILILNLEAVVSEEDIRSAILEKEVENA